jgi:hypothetical protein
MLAWPSSRMRYVSLGLMHWVLHVATFVAVLTGAVYFCMPSLAPDALVQWLEPLRTHMPASGPQWVWLAVAALVVVLGKPVLAVVHFAQHVAGLQSMVLGLRREVRGVAGDLEQAMAATNREPGGLAPERLGDLTSAMQMMASISGANCQGRHQPRVLADYLK